MVSNNSKLTYDYISTFRWDPPMGRPFPYPILCQNDARICPRVFDAIRPGPCRKSMFDIRMCWFRRLNLFIFYKKN